MKDPTIFPRQSQYMKRKKEGRPETYPSSTNSSKINYPLKIGLDLFRNRRTCPTPEILSRLAHPVQDRNDNPGDDMSRLDRITEPRMNIADSVGALETESVGAEDNKSGDEGCDGYGEEHDRGPQRCFRGPWAPSIADDVARFDIVVDGLGFLFCSHCCDGYGC